MNDENVEKVKRRTVSTRKRRTQTGKGDGLNICLMNDSFPPTIDGVGNAVENYARVLSDKFGRCTVVTPDYPEVVDKYPFQVIRYPSMDTTKLAGYRTGMPIAPFTMVKLSKMDFDIIHTHCPIISTVLARSLRDSIHVPIVFTYHTKFDIEISRMVKGKLLQETATKMLVANIAACDEVWVVSNGAGENLRSLGYEGEFIVMPNGVDLPKGRVEQSVYRELDEKWKLPQQVPIYVFIGRIMWYKGLRQILEALAKLKAEGRDFCMVFVGDGQDKPEVEQTAAELGLEKQCIFTGLLRDREELRNWFSRADLMLFPSDFDTNGLVVREAAACGLGSVLLRGSCAAEGITDGENGILIDESPEALAEVLRQSTPDFCRRIGENAMNEIYLSWEDSIGTAYNRYKTILERWHK